MNKKDRKQAVRAEIERRAANSGVPKELFVYEMKCHHDDEGGPRTFVPTEESDRLESGRYDPSLWPSLFESAIRDAVPIEMTPDNSRMYRDGRTPLADICIWGDGSKQLLILTERANAALEPFLRRTCRPVPVTCASLLLFGYTPVAIEDVLSAADCEADWMDLQSRKICLSIKKYSFYSAKLGPSPLFRIPQDHHQILVLQPFVDAVRQHNLTGFRYKRVWPYSPIPPVVTVEVKKLPRFATDKQRDPKLSTFSKRIPTDFLDRLLGSPLTADDGTPAELVAYRLPDLSLPSGSIVAADLLLDSGKPFDRKVTPGDYPLTLVAARINRRSDERIAFAMVQFSDRPVDSWEVATIGKTSDEGPNKSFAHRYGVDSGAGGLCDAQTQELLLDLADPEGTQRKRIEKEMAKTYQHTRSWVHVQTRAGSAAVFSSGDGDGQYRSWFGLDHAGEPVVIMTDFEVLNWPRMPQRTLYDG